MQTHAEKLRRLLKDYEMVIVGNIPREEEPSPKKALAELQSEVDRWVEDAADMTPQLFGWS